MLLDASVGVSVSNREARDEVRPCRPYLKTVTQQVCFHNVQLNDLYPGIYVKKQILHHDFCKYSNIRRTSGGLVILVTGCAHFFI